ncbi:MAG TPA: hypothetical protein PK308_00195 [Phycisphaerales bacterium]|nr:hypothetical protein [Phycisphaerales bacterium]
MQLAKLVRAEQWDLREIFRPHAWVDGFWAHLTAHLLGGAFLWWATRGDVRGVTLFAVFWVFVVEEANSTRGFDYPIWAMLWDAGTMIATAALLRRIV